MVRVKLLLMVVAIACCANFVTAQVSFADGKQCAVDLVAAGLCAPPATGVIRGGGVDLSAGFDSGSGGTGKGRTGARQNGGAKSDGPAGGGSDGTEAGPVGPDAIVRDGFLVFCTPGTPCDPNLVVTVTDLVNFKPATPTQGMEPDGWMIVGLPANFFAAASVHVKAGLLLGFPAEVRFTPVGYHWDYGDGTTGRSATGGASWAALNLPEFTDTPTSHSYSKPGSYVITLTVEYTADYRFAGPSWRGVRGTLTVPASPLNAVAGEARTVLVARECTHNPSGPGC